MFAGKLSRRVLVFGLVIGFGVAGCGGDDQGTSSSAEQVPDHAMGTVEAGIEDLGEQVGESDGQVADSAPEMAEDASAAVGETVDSAGQFVDETMDAAEKKAAAERDSVVEAGEAAKDAEADAGEAAMDSANSAVESASDSSH